MSTLNRKSNSITTPVIMVIAAAPDGAFVGGEVYNGPGLGDYHVVVSDAQLGETNKKDRKQLILELTVKGDPNHASMEGKKLTKMWQSFPNKDDDDQKRKQMLGIIKRQVYEGFGLPWPKESKALDPRIFVGKEAWVRFGERKDKEGKMRQNITHVVQKAENLPKGNGVPAGKTEKAAGTASSRRRAAPGAAAEA